MTTKKKSTFNGFILFMAVFMIVWIISCYIADQVLHLGADSWRMAFGYLAVVIAGALGEIVEDKYNMRIANDQ